MTLFLDEPSDFSEIIDPALLEMIFTSMRSFSLTISPFFMFCASSPAMKKVASTSIP